MIDLDKKCKELIDTEWLNVNDNTTHILLDMYATTGGTMMKFTNIQSEYDNDYVFFNFVDEDAKDYKSYIRKQWTKGTFYRINGVKKNYDTSIYDREIVEMKKLETNNRNKDQSIS